MVVGFYGDPIAGGFYLFDGTICDELLPLALYAERKCCFIKSD